jgi:hypothetical protein
VRVRPRRLDEFVGQEHLLGKGSALRTAIEQGHPHAMILYGPPRLDFQDQHRTNTSADIVVGTLDEVDMAALSDGRLAVAAPAGSG